MEKQGKKPYFSYRNPREFTGQIHLEPLRRVGSRLRRVRVANQAIDQRQRPAARLGFGMGPL